MNTLLTFIHKGKKYIIFENNHMLLLACTKDNQLIDISDNEKEYLHQLIKGFIDVKYTKEKILKRDIIIVKNKSINSQFDSHKLIGLIFNDEQRKLLITNCQNIYKKTHYSYKYKVIYLITTTFLILISIILFYYLKVNNNIELFKKYQKIKDNKTINNQTVEIVSINHHNSNNLFKDDYISFDNYCDKYELITSEQTDNNPINIYQSDKCPYLAIIKYEQDDELNQIELDNENEKYNISELYNRYKIRNMYDLLYNSVVYSEKKISSKSKKNEIIDGIFFENVKSIIMPYNQESKINDIILFDKDIKGYAHITQKKVLIVLYNNQDRYNIIIQNSSNEDINISKESIINIVSTIQYN